MWIETRRRQSKQRANMIRNFRRRDGLARMAMTSMECWTTAPQRSTASTERQKSLASIIGGTPNTLLQNIEVHFVRYSLSTRTSRRGWQVQRYHDDNDLLPTLVRRWLWSTRERWWRSCGRRVGQGRLAARAAVAVVNIVMPLEVVVVVRRSSSL